MEWIYYEHWGGDAITNVTIAYIESKEIPHLKSGDIFKIIQRRDDVLDSEKPSAGQSAKSASSRDSVNLDTRPDASAPVQDTLLYMRNKQQQSSDGESNEDEKNRMFGSSVSTEKLYKHDEVLQYTEGKQDKLTENSHMFVDIDLSTPKGLFQFAYETLQFACACLNDRTNGTIHFGVASQQTGAQRPGTVIGTRLTKHEDYTKYLRNAVQRCFTSDLQAVVSSCVQDPAFIKVVGPKKDTYVVEVHVIPSCVSCQDEAFFVRLPRSKPSKGESLELDKPAVFRWKHDKPSRVAADKLKSFMKSKQSLAIKRRIEEQAQCQAESGITETLTKKLVRLLCHGKDDFVGESYPILVINKPDKQMDQSFLKNTMSFLNKIQWKAVFDFDADATICKFFDSQEERAVEIITTASDFNPRSAKNIQNPGCLENLKNSIRTSNRCPWIFCNGHNDSRNDQLDPITWNKEENEGFKKAVEFFGDEIPKGRGVIVHLLLSDEWKVMMEAAQCFYSMFSDQCMCVTAEECCWMPWKDELVHRHCDSAEQLDDRAVVGMSWKQVNQAVEVLSGPKQQGECRVPSSGGPYVTIKPHILQRLEDLEVLGANQCENSEILKDAHALEEHRLKTEELFYRGNKADWWNFHFSDHVLRRDKQDLLTHTVDHELEGRSSDRSHVRTIKVKHQPGSGGTTTAMQTLWDFRKQYRCAIVRKISRDTVNQILQLHSHEDASPRPVLLLLDNADDEHATDLKIELEEQSKRKIRSNPNMPKVTCVFIECVRSTKPVDSDIMITHKLSKEEIKWFEMTNRRLEETHSENSGANPKLLLSFNIMRKNFDPEYIKAQVKEVIGDIESHKEKTLLKYIALVNTYEVGFDPLPTAAFDLLMNEGPIQPRGKYKTLTLWETELSPALGILINEVSSTSAGYGRSLRMASPLLSKHVLTELRKQPDGTEQSMSDLVDQFFSDNYVFRQISQSKKALCDLVKTMLVRRERFVDGSPDTAFAPLIEHIYTCETPDKACDVIQHGYELIKDAFIAQQIARLYIKRKNWQKAVEYAKLSTDQISYNSYLWDTYGRVYLLQVEHDLEEIKTEGVTRNRNEEIGRIVEMAMKGIDIFQTAQKVNEMEARCNEAGYVNELKLTMKLIDYLRKTGAFGDEEHTRQILVGAADVPRAFVFLKGLGGQDYAARLKQIHSRVLKTLVYLDDKNLHLSHTLHDDRSQRNREHLNRLKRRYFFFFGKPLGNDSARRRLPVKERCEDRRRQLSGYECYALGNIFKQEETKLLEMQRLVQANVDDAAPVVNAEDLRVLICVNLVLSVNYRNDESTSMYNLLSQHSCNVYEHRHKLSMMYLEAYLFYVMFNWPRTNVICRVHPRLLVESLPRWKDDFFRRYPKHKDAKSYRNRPTTKFFLANGNGMKSIFCNEGKMDGMGEGGFWRDPDILDKLQRFTGILVDDGCTVEVNVEYGDTQTHIKIPTSFPIPHRAMWFKKVYFVIGFSWDGPKAFDVDLENPAAQHKQTTDTHRHKERR